MHKCMFCGKTFKVSLYLNFHFRNQFIVSGLDDGLILIWEKNTENNLLLMNVDKFIVNCIQPHQSEFLLTTSGIEQGVKLWSPLPNLKDDVDNTIIINDYNTIAALNQRTLTVDGFQLPSRDIILNRRQYSQ